MRALLTAFGPFRGRPANQSQGVLERCARRLPEPWRAELLPVDLGWVRALALQRAGDPALVAWLALGEAGEDGGPGPPRLESLARNRYDLREDEESAAGEPLAGEVEAGGPAEAFAPASCLELAAWLRGRGHGIGVSRDAGAHCCNALLYASLRAGAARAPAPWIGFLHLPRRASETAEQARLVLDALGWIGERAAAAFTPPTGAAQAPPPRPKRPS